MPHPRATARIIGAHRQRLAWMVIFAMLAACRADTPSGRTGSPAAAELVSTPAAGHARDLHGWDPGAGPALLVQGAELDEAIALTPAAGDTIAIRELEEARDRQAPVSLLGRSGRSFSALLDGDGDLTGLSTCARLPLRAVRGGGAEQAWSVGFVNATVRPVALDSVESLSAKDSLALAAEASRLASAVTGVSAATFQGLRFVAHDLRTFEAAPGVQALAAHLVRRVNQEASPQEEQTLLIAERDSGVTTGPYRLVHADRSTGREEEVATPEVMAGARMGTPTRVALIIARETEAGVSYSLLERNAARHWRVRWTSAVVRCN